MHRSHHHPHGRGFEGHGPWQWMWDIHCSPFGSRHHGRGGGHHGHGHGPGPGHPPPPPWFFHMFGGPPRRAERGEVRYLILDAIAEQPRHGYEIIQTIEERSGGGYRPSPGTIYPTLQMLEELGHVRAVELEGRKVYELTDAGRAELDEHREDVDDAYERFGSGRDWDEMPEFHETWQRIHRLVRSLARAFKRQRITPKKWRAIQQAIGDAADQIERILRED